MPPLPGPWAASPRSSSRRTRTTPDRRVIENKHSRLEHNRSKTNLHGEGSYRRAEAEEELQVRSSACSQGGGDRGEEEEEEEEEEEIQRRSSACSQYPPFRVDGHQEVVCHAVASQVETVSKLESSSS